VLTTLASDDDIEAIARKRDLTAKATYTGLESAAV
jgi:hypothetical protein